MFGPMSVWIALAFVLAAAPLETNFFQVTRQQFTKAAAAKEVIRFEAVKSDLLSAAVLHETNRRREENGLPTVKHHPKAIEAAAIQSRIMAQRGSISHENPENEKYQTLIKRVRAVGVNPGFAAENVAKVFGLQYESGRPFYTREVKGKTIFSFTPNGPAIPPHTYESFARALVEAWMNSPGHRKNILHESAEYLGVSCVISAAKSEMPLFFCAQVFLAPLKLQ